MIELEIKLLYQNPIICYCCKRPWSTVLLCNDNTIIFLYFQLVVTFCSLHGLLKQAKCCFMYYISFGISYVHMWQLLSS